MFLDAGRVREITIASEDAAAIVELLAVKFGPVEILARTELDARTLALLKLQKREWLEWTPMARRR